MIPLLVTAPAAAWRHGEAAAGQHATAAEGRGCATAAAARTGSLAAGPGVAASRLSGLPPSAGTNLSRLAAPGSARRLGHVEEHPLVVMVPALVEADRFVLALAP